MLTSNQIFEMLDKFSSNESLSKYTTSKGQSNVKIVRVKLAAFITPKNINELIAFSHKNKSKDVFREVCFSLINFQKTNPKSNYVNWVIENAIDRKMDSGTRMSIIGHISVLQNSYSLEESTIEKMFYAIDNETPYCASTIISVLRDCNGPHKIISDKLEQIVENKVIVKKLIQIDANNPINVLLNAICVYFRLKGSITSIQILKEIFHRTKDINTKGSALQAIGGINGKKEINFFRTVLQSDDSKSLKTTLFYLISEFGNESDIDTLTERVKVILSKKNRTNYNYSASEPELSSLLRFLIQFESDDRVLELISWVVNKRSSYITEGEKPWINKLKLKAYSKKLLLKTE